ncbi:MAG: shikimate kinase [Oscillospiraceae bacterium]|nr:shikimate kinase [Oscillospiraceae bacterium]
MKCGLLGEKLGHSYSPRIHSQLGDYAYDLYEKRPEELEDFLKNGDFTGLNVTIPYKKAVIPYCARLSETAQKLQSVNTLLRLPDGSLEGHNTDYFGFLTMLQGLTLAGKKALVLGSGGASNTAAVALRDQRAQVVVISRKGENNYENLHLHRDAAVLVNATPVGMYPNVGVAPLDIGQFPKLEAVLDVIYNPARTKLLQEAMALGIPVVNGLEMLVAQAQKSAEIWTGVPMERQKTEEILRLLRGQMENIVLVGMPGCGKSAVGRKLAQKTGLRFVDMDEEICRLAGISIPEIFAKQGEEAFRALETQIAAKLGKESGLVIATGGGCVTRAENEPLLRQNGTVFWLRRALYKLPKAGRPLSQAGSLEEMYRRREPMYRQFADFAIDNDGAAEKTVAEILEKRREAL